MATLGEVAGTSTDSTRAGRGDAPPSRLRLGGRLRNVRSALSPSRKATLLLAAVVATSAAVLRLLTVQAAFITSDEPLWTERSQLFSDAVAKGDLAGLSATQDTGDVVTMPGVTTMWIGSLARVIWAAARNLGLVADDGAEFRWSESGLDIAQGVMALTTALLIGVVVLLVVAWVGRPAGCVAGLLLATEPFWVAHGAVLHTDELYTLSGLAGLLAAVLYLGLPDRTIWAGRRLMAGGAGLFLATSALTKMSAVMFLPCLGFLVLWWLYRRGARLTDRATWGVARPLLGAGFWFIGPAAALTLLAYPALLANPFEEPVKLVRSSALSVLNHPQFFLGEVTDTPGPLYYMVATPFRMTPWFLIAAVVASVVIIRTRSLRGHAFALAGLFVLMLLILSFTTKQFDRYSLPLMGILAVAVGTAVQHGWRFLRDRPGCRPLMLWVPAAALAGFVFAHALVVGPWGQAYYNPAVGGSSTASDALLIGWGDGVEGGVEVVEEVTGVGCDEVELHVAQVFEEHLKFWGCVPARETRDPDQDEEAEEPEASDEAHVILYASQRQRMTAEELDDRIGGRELLGAFEVRGLVLVEVYSPRAAASGDR